jgi:hypothetical protein
MSKIKTFAEHRSEVVIADYYEGCVRPTLWRRRAGSSAARRSMCPSTSIASIRRWHTGTLEIGGFTARKAQELCGVCADLRL